MGYLSNNKNIIEEHIKIKDIPCIILKPRDEEGLIPTIILYHGWSSNKDRQKFRGFILSSLGYQVIIPDSIYHGERNPIDHNNITNMAKCFWEVVLNNIRESEYIISEIINKYNGDPNNIGVMGHSMGGFTAAGIFTHDDRIKTGIPLNGSFNWGMCNEIFARNLDYDIVLEEEGEVIRLDPMNNLEKIVDRPILMLNGGADEVVPMAPQRIFYDKIKDSYKDGSKVKLIKYSGLGHFVSINMLEDVAKWLKVQFQ